AGRFAGRFQPGAPPGILRTLDDEGAGAGVEGVRMHLEEPVVVAAEDEGEGIERQIAAEPHVLRRMDGDLRLEELGMCPPDQTVDPVGTDDQIGACEFIDVSHFSLEINPDPERLAAPLQDIQYHLARNTSEDMAARADLRVAVVDVDR